LGCVTVAEKDEIDKCIFDRGLGWPVCQGFGTLYTVSKFPQFEGTYGVFATRRRQGDCIGQWCEYPEILQIQCIGHAETMDDSIVQDQGMFVAIAL
jgi:hypothetical protein